MKSDNPGSDIGVKRSTSAPDSLDFLPQPVKFAMDKIRSRTPEVPQFASSHLNSIVNNMGSFPDLMNSGEIFSEVSTFIFILKYKLYFTRSVQVAYKDALFNFVPYVVVAYLVVYGLQNHFFLTSTLLFVCWIFGLHTLIDKKMLSKDKV